MTVSAEGMNDLNLRMLPVAIRRVSVDRSGKWLTAGWRDMWKAPGVSFAYGGAFVLARIRFNPGRILRQRRSSRIRWA